MKNTFLFLVAAALLAACGSPDTSDLGKKRLELDSLKAAYKELGEKIKEADLWIADHDTTVKKNLPAVTTLVLAPTRFEHFVQAHGHVKADKSADLYSMGGRVRSILVKKGDRVRKGQLLVDLDNDAIEKQVAQAKAGYDLAKEVFEKQERLWKQQIGSEVQYLQAKSNKEQAEAAVAALNEQYRMSRITAPFDGTMDDIMVSVGEMTAPQFPVARVVDLTGASLEADVPESYLQRVKVGDPVSVEFPSLNDTIVASLANVSRYIDPANRTFKVTLRVPNGETYVRPNMLSVVHIRDVVKDSAIVVPSRCIQEDVSGKSYVFVLDKDKDGRAITRKVVVSRVMDSKDRTLLAPNAGLVGNETILDEGAKSVGDGQRVKVTNL
ncbi:MAG: efflux RND transporter periplasmic adaptor subunit [Flavobacteriales bacterium]|nr:efflux RND transporter periplasmic adaptor subunit [Flavobacteriales bacterium]